MFKTRDGRERESIPVKFKDTSDRAVTLVEGDDFVAPAMRAAAVNLHAAR